MATNEDKSGSSINRNLAIITKILEKMMEKLSEILQAVLTLTTKVEVLIDDADKCQKCAITVQSKTSEWLQKLVWIIVGGVISGVGYLIVKLLENGGKP